MQIWTLLSPTYHGTTSMQLVMSQKSKKFCWAILKAAESVVQSRFLLQCLAAKHDALSTANSYLCEHMNTEIRRGSGHLAGPRH